MSKFDYMNFTGGVDTEFVIHANKFTKEQAIENCVSENDWLFEDGTLRQPTIEDVEERTAKYYVTVPEYCSYEGEDGCYTYCNKGVKGSFPVWVIGFADLRN